MPKLIIKIFGSASEDVCELEQARYLLDFDSRIIQVEGQTVHSYDELAQIATQDKYQNKEFIEVMMLPTIMGG